MKVLNKMRFIPFLIYIHAWFYIHLCFPLGACNYDMVRYYTGGYHQYVTGSSNYSWKWADFYTCAFTYDVTLVPFIFLIINAILIAVGLVFGIIQLACKQLKIGLLIFNIIFSSLFFTTGLVMSIFMVACSKSGSDAGYMCTMAFFSTFLVTLVFMFSVAAIIVKIVSDRKARKAAEQQPA